MNKDKMTLNDVNTYLCHNYSFLDANEHKNSIYIQFKGCTSKIGHTIGFKFANPNPKYIPSSEKPYCSMEQLSEAVKEMTIDKAYCDSVIKQLKGYLAQGDDIIVESVSRSAGDFSGMVKRAQETVKQSIAVFTNLAKLV